MNSRRKFFTTCITTGTALILTGALPKREEYFPGCCLLRPYNIDDIPWYKVAYIANEEPRCKYKAVHIKGNDGGECTIIDCDGTIDTCGLPTPYKCPTYKNFVDALNRFEDGVQKLEKEMGKLCNRYIVIDNNNNVGLFASINKCYNFRSA